MADYVLRLAGVTELSKAVKAAGEGLDKELRADLRKALAPIVADARRRFAGLAGTGPRTAKTVKGSITQRGIAVTMGGRGGAGSGYELGREFGSKGGKFISYEMKGGGWATGWRGHVSRFMPYDRPSVFGAWTGNQLTLDPSRTSGHAFYPAIAHGATSAVADVTKTLEQYVGRIAGAGS